MVFLLQMPHNQFAQFAAAQLGPRLRSAAGAQRYRSKESLK